MSTGKVKDYDSSRGFGSIIDSATGQLLTVYANSIELAVGEILNKGQDVSFEVENRRTENWAIHVKLL